MSDIEEHIVSPIVTDCHDTDVDVELHDHRHQPVSLQLRRSASNSSSTAADIETPPSPAEYAVGSPDSDGTRRRFTATTGTATLEVPIVSVQPAADPSGVDRTPPVSANTSVEFENPRRNPRSHGNHLHAERRRGRSRSGSRSGSRADSESLKSSTSQIGARMHNILSRVRSSSLSRSHARPRSISRTSEMSDKPEGGILLNASSVGYRSPGNDLLTALENDSHKAGLSGVNSTRDSASITGTCAVGNTPKSSRRSNNRLRTRTGSLEAGIAAGTAAAVGSGPGAGTGSVTGSGAAAGFPGAQDFSRVSVDGENYSSDSDTGSQASLTEDTDEDVCFPMIQEGSGEPQGINFAEIDAFIEASRLADRSDSSSTFSSLSKKYTPEGIISEKTEGEAFNSRLHKLSRIISNGTVKSRTRGLSNASSAGDRRSARNGTSGVTFGGNRYEGVGEVPERFSFFCSNKDETIHATDLPALLDGKESFRSLFESGSGTWWLDCMNPTDAEMKVLAKTFAIHPLTAEDIRLEETREKVELFRSYYFICFNSFDQDKESEDFLEPINVYIVVFKDGILTFHFSPIQHCANVRRRIRQLREYVDVSADWISYALIDDITDSFAPVIHEIEYEADAIEDSVFVARELDFAFMLRRIGEARRKVMTLIRLLSGKADVIKMFAKRCNEHWNLAPKGEVALYLGDIQDHILTMSQNLSTYEKIFSRSHANYLAQLQVETVNANNRVTQVLGKVTLIGTILVPLNLVTGLFGMNVTVPGENQGNLRWFFIIVGVILGLVCLFSIMARYWLFHDGDAFGDEPGTSTGVAARSSTRGSERRSIRSIANRFSLSRTDSRRND